MGGCVAAPAAFAHHDRREVEVEGLADARLDAAIGSAAADDDGVARNDMRVTAQRAKSISSARRA